MRIVRSPTLLSVLFFFTAALLLLVSPQVQAQEIEFRLDVNRDFGYGNGSDVRGNFSLTIYGAQESIRTVKYLMDGEEIGQVSQAPFRFRFSTSDYPDGWHELSAVVETTDNRSAATPVVRLNFISSAQQSAAMKRIFSLTLVLIVIGGGIGVATQFITLRGGGHTTPGVPKRYGLLGGTICPRCNRPYSIHIWSISLIGGRLDRCEHCGKWAFIQRRRPDLLAAAEKAGLQAAQAEENTLPGAAEESDEEKLHRLLDESRYSKL